MLKTNQPQEDFFTQKQLASRWQVSQSTIKNYRDTGKLPFFRFPGSKRVLYPVSGILNLEAEHTHQLKQKEVDNTVKRKQLEVSSTKQWRI